MNAAPPNASQTARQRARAELTREIKEAARRQLAQDGAAQLSLRAVARELGLVSSALYRYFPSRDDLLTALIIDAYDSLGEAAEAAAAANGTAGPRRGWQRVCHAVRDWARARPHEYALIYGSPVPGYQAPRDTVAPAARVPLVLGRLVRDSCGLQDAPSAATDRPTDRPTEPTGPAGPGAPAVQPDPPIPPLLAAQAAIVAGAIAPGVPEPVIVRVLIAWTQLFGMISFELFGQFVGSTDPADEFFDYAIEQMIAYVPITG
jgi:AcrR family transcriptional regulator